MRRSAQRADAADIPAEAAHNATFAAPPVSLPRSGGAAIQVATSAVHHAAGKAVPPLRRSSLSLQLRRAETSEALQSDGRMLQTGKPALLPPQLPPTSSHAK
mmetsp:Transcript_12052/g.19071  ORF Transcript_12052/g.19071 Transcript_12052/m.19071 type:complete len:102 (+) Transcript_12052:514-819(+)